VVDKEGLGCSRGDVEVNRKFQPSETLLWFCCSWCLVDVFLGKFSVRVGFGGLIGPGCLALKYVRSKTGWRGVSLASVMTDTVVLGSELGCFSSLTVFAEGHVRICLCAVWKL